MNIIAKWSPNFGYPQGSHGRSGNLLVAICDHIAAGTAAGLDATFLNPASEVSAHYGVMKDGSVHRYVRDEDAAYGAGILNHPDTSLPWLPPLAPSTGRLVNQRVISIEHEGNSGDALTDAQFAATVELHRTLIAKWSIPVDRDHIIGHYRLDSVNRAGCPGSGFPWDELFEKLEQLPEEPDMLTDAEKADATNALNVAWGVAQTLDTIQGQFPQPQGEKSYGEQIRDAVVVLKGILAARGL